MAITGRDDLSGTVDSSGMSSPTEASCWERELPDGRMQCLICPRHCRLRNGQYGFCNIRSNRNGHIVCHVFDYWSGGCVDPVEKKPLYHFLPGTHIYSFGSIGCNLACQFCQNWHLSRSKASQTTISRILPRQIVKEALRQHCPSVAFTYNDPIIYADAAVETANLCHEQGLRTVAVTAGYIDPTPRKAFFSAMDAANIDLKSFDEMFYRRFCGAPLAPILDTLKYVHRETSVWLEVTTLLIPGLNDSDEELDRASDWFVENLGTDVPWHFSAFHPDYKMIDRPRTPIDTLQRACRVARSKGVHYAYSGNVQDIEGSTTHCPGCDAPLIERIGFTVVRDFCKGARCPKCGYSIAGVWS